MKTLDEVIKAFEICWEQETCNDECPYKGQPCTKQREIDGLNYLKQYKDLQYGYIKAMADLEDNPPLTWDELRGMQNKPVWVEGQYPHSWCIVREVQKYMDGTEEIVLDGLNCKIGIGRKEKYGTGWQAYRKERS